VSGFSLDSLVPLGVVGYKPTMPTTEHAAWTQLATRIPKSLHRQLKLHAVYAEVTLMDFVVAALEEKLAREQGRAKRRA
jgi:hypothetical protein